MRIGTLMLGGAALGVAYVITRHGDPKSDPGSLTHPPDPANGLPVPGAQTASPDPSGALPAAPDVPASPQADAIAALEHALQTAGCSPEIYPLVIAAHAAGVDVLPPHVIAKLDLECPALYLDLQQHLVDLLTSVTPPTCKDLYSAAAMLQLIGATITAAADTLIAELCG